MCLRGPCLRPLLPGRAVRQTRDDGRSIRKEVRAGPDVQSVGEVDVLAFWAESGERALIVPAAFRTCQLPTPHLPCVRCERVAPARESLRAGPLHPGSHVLRSLSSLFCGVASAFALD